MSNLDNHIQSLIALLQDNADLLLAVYYGSRDQQRDIDLLVVYAHEPPRSEFIAGKLDLTLLSMRQVKHFIGLADLAVTEPFLTGECVVGNPDTFQHLKQLLLDTKPNTSRVSRYLLQRSFRAYMNALDFLHGEPTEDTNVGNDKHTSDEVATLQNNLILSCLNLSYAISYFVFAQYYSSGHDQIVSLSDLRNDFPYPLSDYYTKAVEYKRPSFLLKADEIYSLINGFELFLLQRARSEV